MMDKRIEGRCDDSGSRIDVTVPSRISLSETPEQYGQRVARELLDKFFNSSKEDSGSR